MASTASTSPDTLVTVKVNFEGTTRRFKLPLRDMGASTLEGKLRAFLTIEPSAECLFERYSDSAAAYVVLDPSNVSVYKQLYRAAKAKQKLKLRVTLKEQAKQVPKPASVEDFPEPSSASSSRAQEKQPILEPISVEPLVESLKRTTLATKLSSTLDADESPEEARLRYILPAWRREMRELREAAARDSRVRLSNLLNDLNELPTARSLGLHETLYAKEYQEAKAKSEAQSQSPESTACPSAGATFAVCCNSCDRTIPDSHYHCSTCDDGDFDLCQACVDQGITCYGDDHWLIKRAVKDGQIHSSTTETIAPKPKTQPTVESLAVQESHFDRVLPLFNGIRTCNCCVTELPEQSFLHCTSCEDYDLCKTCFAKDAHGHHPRHGFVPAVEGTRFNDTVTLKLSPGRHQIHNAICDGCEKFIAGVRHKCLDCPDWDYCGDCVANASFIHPNHRFVPVYEPLSEPGIRAGSRPIHYSIRCDGPLCRSKEGYIAGVRYKCAVCHDTDYCANCEASPALTHNKTHPLIKFKTPVRHVSVTTTGERDDGHKMPLMGDRPSQPRSRPSSATTSKISVNTVMDIKPEPATVKAEPAEAKVEPEAAQPEVAEVKKEAEADPSRSVQELSAVYVRDTVTDGTVLPPNHNFQQTWILRNTGTTKWPAGCSVKFVGGDYMGHVDSNHPAGISELVSASESTRCYTALAPGQEFPFTVLLRTPSREGKIISYWRLTTADGFKFGHRLWCDVNVQAPKTEEPKEEPKQQEPEAEETKTETSEETQTSQMIFPKLEKESPVQSVHEDDKPDAEVGHAETRAEDETVAEGYEDCEDDEWDGSEDGFMTDEEYDILDASDEEYLDQQSKSVKK